LEESKSPVSDGSRISNINREGDFENFIPKFIEIIRHQSPSLSVHEKEYVEEKKLYCLTILANLSLREYLRPMIFANEGL
jgi:hypothetical protein